VGGRGHKHPKGKDQEPRVRGAVPTLQVAYSLTEEAATENKEKRGLCSQGRKGKGVHEKRLAPVGMRPRDCVQQKGDVQSRAYPEKARG